MQYLLTTVFIEACFFHTDITRLLEMPIDALYFHFWNLKQGMGWIPKANYIE